MKLLEIYHHLHQQGQVNLIEENAHLVIRKFKVEWM